MRYLKKTIITTIATTAIFVGHVQVSTSIEKRHPVIIDITWMRCTPCGDLSLWLDDLFNEYSIVIYPNLSEDFFTIESELLKSADYITVFSTDGKIGLSRFKAKHCIFGRLMQQNG
jgi:hypothetical protein